MTPAPPLLLEPLFEIPAVPVEVLLTIALLVVLIAALRRRSALTVPRVLLAVAWAFYAAGVVRSVLLPMPILVGAVRAQLPSPEVFVQPLPIVTSLADPMGMILNAGLFVPLGILLPFTLHRPTFLRVTLIGLAVSLGIETTQLVLDLTLSTGRVADVDDLIANTLGTAIGYVCLSIAVLVPWASRLAAAAVWPRVRATG